jgi:hypothetical protein
MKPLPPQSTSDYDRTAPVPETQSGSIPELDGKTENGEHEFEHYIDDGLRGPTSDKLPPDEDNDPNVVTWDGPNDPANPKNWSRPYRWLITLLCCITTLNVYAFPHAFFIRITDFVSDPEL